MIIRLLFHDYTSARYTAVSLNSGLFGSILLASRLHSNNQTVLIILLGLLLFRKTPKKTLSFAVTLFSFHIIQQYLYIQRNGQIFRLFKVRNVTLNRKSGLQCWLHIIAQVLICFIGPYLLTRKGFFY